MTFSSCCSDYKFPIYQGDTSCRDKKVDLLAQMNGLTVSTPLKVAEESDYFAIKASAQAPLLSPKFNMKPTIHQQGTNSISSLTSEATLVEGLSVDSVDLSHSTDTLLSELANSSPKSRRNFLLLRLSMANRQIPKLMSGGIASARLHDNFSRIEEELPSQLAHSAVDSHFAFHRYLQPEREGSFPFKTTTQKPPLTLRKQATLPSLSPLDLSFNTIKNEQAKRSLYVPPVENMRAAILGLSPNIKYMPAARIAEMLASNDIDSRTNLHSLFVMDIRSFADFVKGNVTGSINVCPPLTLLRRSTFNLTKCVNSLPTYERLIILNYLHFNTENVALNTQFKDSPGGLYGMPPIFIYDNNNYSASLYHMCKKLVDHSCWDAESDPPIYLLDGPFLDLSLKFGDLISKGKSETIDIASLEISSLVEPTIRSDGDEIAIRPLDTTLRQKTERAHSTAGIPTFALDTSTPSVSNFSLPQNLPQSAFKIRHNEEVLDFDFGTSMDTPISQLTKAELDVLPKWLRDAVSNADHIKDDFNKLEVCEKMRLNNALSLESKPELITPGGKLEISPIINCGLDYGHKNRYKDVFLYDHSRVKLQAENRLDLSLDHDYINASYLEPNLEFTNLISELLGSKEQLVRDLKVIATQGPLEETIGDFWKCVLDQECLLIISLTEEYEGGFKKCSAYWKPGVYKSGSSEVVVDLINERTSGRFLIRSFTVTTEGLQRHVLQIQLNQWQDMSVTVNPLDILSVVSLKQFILGEVKPQSGCSTISHCSAGCGRKGVFCTVDSLIGLLKHNDNECQLPYDPIYELVNGLRRQRILMVQTMRQYSLVYDVVVQYALRTKFDCMDNLDIVKEFIGHKKMELKKE